MFNLKLQRDLSVLLVGSCVQVPRLANIKPTQFAFPRDYIYGRAFTTAAILKYIHLIIFFYLPKLSAYWVQRFRLMITNQLSRFNYFFSGI